MLETTEAAPKRTRHLWRPILLIALVVLCAGAAVLAAFIDQPALLGNAYLQAVVSGNEEGVNLIADHFSDDQKLNRFFLGEDFKRDSEYLAHAEIGDVRTERTQTLSGQWVTLLRFKYRPEGLAAPWKEGALRIKTDSWLVLTYLRAVEQVEP